MFGSTPLRSKLRESTRIGCALFLAPVLKFLPRAVLQGSKSWVFPQSSWCEKDQKVIKVAVFFLLYEIYECAMFKRICLFL